MLPIVYFKAVINTEKDYIKYVYNQNLMFILFHIYFNLYVEYGKQCKFLISLNLIFSTVHICETKKIVTIFSFSMIQFAYYLGRASALIYPVHGNSETVGKFRIGYTTSSPHTVKKM